MRTPNPYNYNLPVAPKMFFGRQGDVKTFTHHLTATQGDSFALIGGRRMGKTSLLESLLRVLEPMVEEPARGLLPLPIFQDLTGEGVDSVITFFRIIGEEAHYKLADLLALPSGVPFTLGYEQPPAPTFRRVLEKWGRTAMEKRGCRLRLILLLDECEQIVEQSWTSELYGALRYLLVRQSTRSLLKVVMTGSHRFLSQVRQRGSPLRNVLKYHRLRVLDEKATRDLISQPTGDVLPEEVVEAIIEQSGGHTFLTQYLMHHLWERGLEKATPETVRMITVEFPHERNDFQDWLNGLGNVGSEVYAVLNQARKPLGEHQIRAAMGAASPGILQALDALCYHGLITQEAGGGPIELRVGCSRRGLSQT